jgi:hypothetical protein
MKKFTFIIVHIFLLVLGLCAQARVLPDESIKAQFINRLEKGEHVKIAALGTSLTGGAWRWMKPIPDRFYTKTRVLVPRLHLIHQENQGWIK